MRSIYIAIPAYSGQVTVHTLLSIVQTMEELHELGWPLKVEVISGDADLARCRNILLGSFMRSDATDMLCIDADIHWGPQAVPRLLRHNVDFCCAVYRTKTPDERYPVVWPEKREMWIDPETGMPLLQADMVPGGFVRLTRRCVEMLAEKSEHGWITDNAAPDLKYPWVYEWTFNGKIRLSEDYVLCRKWQAAGGTVWVDPAINLDHIGVKSYEGNLIKHLAKEMGDAMPHRTPIEMAEAALRMV